MMDSPESSLVGAGYRESLRGANHFGIRSIWLHSLILLGKNVMLKA
jgi:hypothetical protein